MLYKSVYVFVQFFKRKGVVSVKDEYNLFNSITGLELQGQGEEFLAQVISCISILCIVRM